MFTVRYASRRTAGSLLATSALAMTVACAHPTRLGVYDEQNRPQGYHWVRHPTSDQRFSEYYGVDPTDGWTVYVGPDGIYYTFPHPPPITTGDLRSYWRAHEVPTRSPLRPTPK
jgi:hypothetical protein